ncbi:MAG: VOC family protein [Caldilineaceae bacterium]|nr:VOC family protein [Caldilineaceae bacterium]
MTQSPALRTDHLVYAVPDLADAVAQIEREWGVRPAMGGKHPTGTHNALLALGPHTYLEVIAQDPEQPHAQGQSFGLSTPPTAPTLVTWAVATTNLDATIDQARADGYDPGATMNGARSRPDGVQLAWRSTRIASWPPPGDGVVPFLIEWGAGTPHPAGDSPQGCHLVSLRAEHPTPQNVAAMLRALGLDIAVTEGSAPALIASIETPLGMIEVK